MDRSTKPVHFTQTHSDMVENQNKYGLKTVRVPISISQRFAEYAKPNTLRKIETCGILFGKLVSVSSYLVKVLRIRVDNKVQQLHLIWNLNT